MFRNINRISYFSILKKIIIAGLFTYSTITTILLFKLNPKPVLIGIDPYGTRIIHQEDDRLILQEKENFIKHFISLQYNYDSSSFDKRISDCGDLMDKNLWDQKKSEFKRLADKLKSEEIKQTIEIKEIREVDALNFEADLIIHIKRRLDESTVKLRIDIKIHKNIRRENNPYPYEVERYDENQSS